ncbi:hypothetical protein FIBSPDRAFT_956657 [Athelia psychrophila]|uniref:Uncharacterized protein n=1 Tax=Athelia psychrophila TaxID=1759441 RepID=A0A166GRU5_9AGAM|nr:hypothetical protein FIBSPDRAFT_956657 [Fibularhizoctonia sp. CBS 109695]
MSSVPPLLYTVVASSWNALWPIPRTTPTPIRHTIASPWNALWPTYNSYPDSAHHRIALEQALAHVQLLPRLGAPSLYIPGAPIYALAPRSTPSTIETAILSSWRPGTHTYSGDWLKETITSHRAALHGSTARHVESPQSQSTHSIP